MSILEPNTSDSLHDASPGLSKRFSEAEVIRVEEDRLWLRTESAQGCGGCSLASGCGTSVLAKLFTSKARKPLILKNTILATEGDRVMISIKESDLVKHSIMVYGVPLIALMVFAFIGLQLTGNDLVSAIGGFAAMGVSWWGVSMFYRPVLPTIERIIAPTVTL